MKAAVLILVTLVWPAPMQAYGASSAVSKQAETAVKPVRSQTGEASRNSPAGSAKHHANAKALNEQRDLRDVLKENLVRGHANLSRTKNPSPPTNGRRYWPSTANHAFQPGPVRPGIEGKGVIQTGAASNVLARSPSISRPSPVPITRLRHRGSNPAVVSGLVSSKPVNAGAINGTRMEHRR